MQNTKIEIEIFKQISLGFSGATAARRILEVVDKCWFPSAEIPKDARPKRFGDAEFDYFQRPFENRLCSDFLTNWRPISYLEIARLHLGIPEVDQIDPDDDIFGWIEGCRLLEYAGIINVKREKHSTGEWWIRYNPQKYAVISCITSGVESLDLNGDQLGGNDEEAAAEDGYLFSIYQKGGSK